MGVTLHRVGEILHYDISLPGLRIRKTTREKSEQRAWKVAEQRYVEAKNRLNGKEPTPTVAKAVEAWLEAHQYTRSANYLRSVETFGRLHLYGLRGVRLDRLDNKLVQAALNQHLAGGRKLETGYAWLRNLKVVCKWAKDNRMLEGLTWRIPMVRLQQKAKVTIPARKVPEWMAALEAATKNPQVILACRMMFGLGLREQEALCARWEWLNLDRGTYTPGKTKGREAWPIPILLIREHLAPIAQPSGWILPGKDGRPHSHGFTLRAMNKANAKVGTPGITPHRLRGSFATLLVHAGITDIKLIQRAMRHKDPRTTWLYLGEDLSALTHGMKRLEESISPSK